MHEHLETVLTLDAARPGGPAEDSPRIYGPFEAMARGANSLGDRFECEAAIDDMSVSDFSVRLRQPVCAGARLFVVMRLCNARVALRGAVMEAAHEACGLWRLRVAILHNRFLS